MDTDLFRLINTKLANPLFDAVMPFVSGNALFYPVLLVSGLVLIWKGRRRGILCVALLAIILPLGDHWVCRTIKKAVGRPRPFVVIVDARKPGFPQGSFGKFTPEMTSPLSQTPRDPPTDPSTAAQPPPPTVPTGSMPSSHAANWFAAAMVAYVYYRRSLWVMLPAAVLVSFSRIYNGVHYPSDVLVGAILGAGYAAAAVWSLEKTWQWAGQKWFPVWWQKLPSLIQFRGPVELTASQSDVDAHWRRLGYLLIGILLLARLIYISGDTLQLTGDEAYQWVWSRHLDLSYYSKPPLIAYAQFLGTILFGDTAFGVRFFSPICAAVLGLALLRFFASIFNARAGFFLMLIVTATPLVSAGAVLMTVDAFSVLFWSLAMIAGWRAIQPDSRTGSWAWVGVWTGLGFLSKYTELFQLLCWAVFFLFWAPARQQLRRPGPYLALLILLVCALPVVIWNWQHQWVTVGHVAGDAKFGAGWSPAVFDFLGAQALLLNPVFFAGMVWAAVAFWRCSRRDPRLIFLFSMGAPLYGYYFLHSFHSRIQPNWIAPSVLPLFCLMVGYWDYQFRLGSKPVKIALIAGLLLGLPAVLVGHDTELIAKFTGHRLPVNSDPLHRARGWREVARLVEVSRQELLREGKPVFVIADHYRLAGELSFYMAAARAAPSDQPLVYCRRTAVPVDQFYFWPGYVSGTRHGENALFLMELDREDSQPRKAPPGLVNDFESVTDLGFREVIDHGRVLWRLQFFACRDLK